MHTFIRSTLTVIFFLTAFNVNAQVKEVDSIIAYMLSPDLMTPLAFKCDDVRKRYDVVRKNLTPFKSRILNCIANKSKAPDDYYLDARYQINIHYNKNMRTQICLSSFPPEGLVQINNNLYMLHVNDIQTILDSIYYSNIDEFFEKD